MRKLAARQATPAVRLPKKSFRQRVVIDFRKNWVIYAIALLCLSYYFVFRYAPMGGLAIAFKNYRPARGLWGSNWAYPSVKVMTSSLDYKLHEGRDFICF